MDLFEKVFKKIKLKSRVRKYGEYKIQEGNKWQVWGDSCCGFGEELVCVVKGLEDYGNYFFKKKVVVI